MLPAMVAPRPPLVRPSRFARTEEGFSLLGTLSVVLILGVLAMIALTSAPSPSSPSPSGSAGRATTLPSSPASGASLATMLACKTDFLSLTLAVEDYLAANGVNPPAGTTWATRPTNGGALIQSWPVINGFTFVWNGSKLSVVPKKGLSSTGSFGTSSPPTGCFAK